MAELKKVRLSQIDPNSFRDIGEYPIDKVKLEILRQSMERTGFWEGYLVVRALPNTSALKRQRYEQAFGHHRVAAARELWGPDYEITVTVMSLSDDMMLAMMANENSERFAQYFYLSVMEPIEATVKAYAEGRIELEKPSEKSPDGHGGTYKLKYAPSFSGGSEDRLRPYTARSVAFYLGWTVDDVRAKDGKKAADRVLTALSALELIERKVLTRQDFLTLTSTQAKVLVDVTRARMRAEQAQVDTTIKVREDALRKAEAEGDTNKVETLKASIADLAEDADKKARRAGKAAASQVLSDLKEKTVKEIVEGARPPEVIETKHVKTATQTLYDLIALWERVCLDTDPKWIRAEPASAKAKGEAVNALLALSKRAKNRAEELGGK